MSCPDCDQFLDRALVEVRRVNDFLRRVVSAGNVKAKSAPIVLKTLAYDASVVLEGKDPVPRGMNAARLAELKARYQK